VGEGVFLIVDRDGVETGFHRPAGNRRNDRGLAANLCGGFNVSVE
jgi:hypothetical protein